MDKYSRVPVVSVVIAVFNGAHFLREALDSVFEQTFRDFEIVCIDDGSTDESPSLLSEYGEQIVVVRQANSGQGSARNTGAQLAKGRYIAFLDQDDRWYPKKLERQVEVLEKNPDVILVYSNSDRMDVEGKIILKGATLAERTSALQSPLGRILEEGLVLPSSMMVWRSGFLEVGGFDPDLRGFEDFDLCARLKTQGRFVFLEDSDLCYRVHGQGFSRSGGLVVVRSRERFLQKMLAMHAVDAMKVRLIRKMLAECYSSWALHEFRMGQWTASLGRIFCSFRYNPLKVRTYLRFLRILATLGLVRKHGHESGAVQP